MGTFRHAYCAFVVGFVVLCGCGAGDGEEVGGARVALREAPCSSSLRGTECDRLRAANRASTAAERLAARQRVANEVTNERAGALRTVAAGSSPAAATNAIEERFRHLRREIVEREAPDSDREEIAQDLARAARRYVPTPADREVGAATRERLRPLEEATRASAGGR